MIPCPNCGLSNADNARFCANCGTPLGATTPPPAYQATAPPPLPYQTSAPASRLTGRNIALGCVVLLAILLFGLSCTRACFGFRRSHYVHRRYAWAPARPSADVFFRTTSRMPSVNETASPVENC